MGIQQSKYHWDETCNIKNYFIWKYCAFKWAKQIPEEEQLQNTAMLQAYERSIKSKERKTKQTNSISSEPIVLIIKKNSTKVDCWLLHRLVEDCCCLEYLKIVFLFTISLNTNLPHSKDSNEQMLKKDVNTLLNPHICSTLIESSLWFYLYILSR